MRVKVTLACTECKQRNYNTTKNKKNNPDRIELQKYCRFCKNILLIKKQNSFYKDVSNNGCPSRSRCESEKRFSLFSYFRETKQELKRVSWPTKKELLKNTGVVLTVVISSTILVWALDSVLSGALKLILK